MKLLHPIIVDGSEVINFDFTGGRVSQGDKMLHVEFRTPHGWWRRTWPHPWKFERF